jgi:hypothetical protein
MDSVDDITTKLSNMSTGTKTFTFNVESLNGEIEKHILIINELLKVRRHNEDRLRQFGVPIPYDICLCGVCYNCESFGKITIVDGLTVCSNCKTS